MLEMFELAVVQKHGWPACHPGASVGRGFLLTCKQPCSWHRDALTRSGRQAPELSCCACRYGLGQIAFRKENWESAIFHFRNSAKVKVETYEVLTSPTL